MMYLARKKPTLRQCRRLIRPCPYRARRTSDGAVARHGIDYESVRPILEAFGSGDVGGALELTSSEVGEKLSIAGTPEEWVEKIEADVLPSGFDHLIVATADPYLVKSWSGMSIEGLPDTKAQLRLFEERVLPMLP